MIACYDLARCPPTYDVVAFLALLEQERLRRGEGSIELHILPGPDGGFRKDSLWPHTVAEREALRERVLVPLCWLLPSVLEINVRSNRAVDGWGKGEYHISLPAILKALQGNNGRPLRAPGRLTNPRLITMTLREAEHHPLRNSNVDEWKAAAQELTKRGYDVVVLRDTAKADHPLNGCRISPMASRHLPTRAGLYAQAALNIGICNGPMWLSVFMNAPTLMLRPTTNAAQGCYDDNFYRRWGLPRGSQLPMSPPHQRLVWDDDSAANIVLAVEDMFEAAAA